MTNTLLNKGLVQAIDILGQSAEEELGYFSFRAGHFSFSED